MHVHSCAAHGAEHARRVGLAAGTPAIPRTVVVTYGYSGKWYRLNPPIAAHDSMAVVARISKNYFTTARMHSGVGKSLYQPLHTTLHR
eukprot:3169151-Pleurochrysis_carterae.AAC.1